MTSDLGLLQNYGGLILSVVLILYGLLISYLQHTYDYEPWENEDI